MSDLLTPIGYGVLVPAALAGTLWLAWVLTARWAPRAVLATGGALALTASFWGGYALLELGPPVPRDPWQWVTLLTLTPLAALVPERLLRLPLVVRLALRLAVAAIASWMLLPEWEELAETRLVWIGGVAAAITVVWTAVAALPEAWHVRVLTLWSAIAIGVAALLFLSGSGKFAQLAGVLAAGLAGSAVASRWRPSAELAAGIVPGAAIGTIGLLLTGYLYSYSAVSWVSYALVAAAPTGLWAGPFVQRLGWSPRRTLVIQVFKVFAVVVLALGLAFVAEWESLMESVDG